MTVLRSPLASPIRSPIYDPTVGKGGGVVFNPAQVFAGGKKGAFHEFYDLSSLRQGSTIGSAAVTADTDLIGFATDKSGNGNHVIQATSGNRFITKANSLGSLFGADVNAAGRKLVAAGALDASFNTAFTMYIMGVRPRTGTVKVAMSSTNGNTFYAGVESDRGSFGTGALSDALTSIVPRPAMDGFIMTGRYNGSQKIGNMHGKNEKISLTEPATNNMNIVGDLVYGELAASFGWDGQILAGLVINDYHSDDTERRIVDYFAGKTGGLMTASTDPMLVADGSSNTASNGISPWPGKIAALLPPEWNISNVAVGGQSVAQRNTAAPTVAYPKFTQYQRKRVAVLSEITNSLSQRAGDVNLILGDLAAWYAGYKALYGGNITVIGTTCAPCTTQEGSRVSVNAALRAAAPGTYCDVLYDIALIPEFADNNNTTYYDPDGIHWRSPLTTIFEQGVAPLILAA